MWYVGSRVYTAARLVFYPGSINSMAMVGATPTISFTMQVENTSGTPLTITGFAGNIFAISGGNAVLIGNVYSFDPVTVDANSTTLVPVTAQLSALSLVSDLIRAFQYGNIQQTISLRGSANLQGLQVPVNLTFAVG